MRGGPRPRYRSAVPECADTLRTGMTPLRRRTLLRHIGLAGAMVATSACASRSIVGPLVLAASSLEGCLDAIMLDWAAQGRVPAVSAYAATPALVRQIEAGAPADLVVTADRDWMQMLGEAGLIAPVTVRAIAGNRLVVVWPQKRAAPPPATVAAALSGNRIAIADTATVPAGRYAKAALEKLDLWAAVSPAVIPAQSARAALALAERGEVDAAIVYASDAAASDTVRTVAFFAEHLHPRIRYLAARVAAAAHPETERLLAHLSSTRAAEIFEQHGFSLP